MAPTATTNGRNMEGDNNQRNVGRAKVAVLGAGSYGTAIAYVASHSSTVSLFCRDKEQAETINRLRFNPKRFKHITLPKNLVATTDFRECVKDADLILHCIPAQATSKFVRRYGKFVPCGVPYVSTSKGIHLETGTLMSECLELAFQGRASDSDSDACASKRAEIPLAFLSGPSFAAEMMQKHPVGVVVASNDSWCRKRVQKILSGKFFRVYTTNDVIGVEVGGALKNPLAIGTGCVKGLGFGQSSIAAIVTRGWLEMSELAVALGGRKETLAGLSGFGDLMLTCYSDKSRNNRFGQCLARGLTPGEAVTEIGEVVEGFPTAIEIMKLAKEHHLKLPLFSAVEKLVTGKKSAKEIFDKLMEGSPCEERFIG